MRVLIKSISITLLICIVALGTINGQNKKDLEQKKKKLEQEIQLTNKLLNETADNKKESLAHLKTLSKQIKIRDELIGTISKEVQSLSGEITSTNKEMITLQNEINAMKEDYAKLLQYT